MITTAFLFPGQGSQWPGMAAGLLGHSPAFTETFLACADAVRAAGGCDLVAAVGHVSEPVSITGGLDDVRVVQPALWAMMVALAAEWRAQGVEPDLVVGHSQGEVAAACVAGALTIDDAARIVVRRAEILLDLAGTGGMLCLGTDVDTAADLVARWPGRLGVAVLNGPRTVLVSGDDEALDELALHCRSIRLKQRRVAVDYAAHSPSLQPLRARLLDALADVAPRPLEVPMISTVTGAAVDGTELDADYWFGNLRRPVLFAPVVAAVDPHVNCWVEVSPHPVLTPAVRATSDHPVFASLWRGSGDPYTLTDSAAQWRTLTAARAA